MAHPTAPNQRIGISLSRFRIVEYDRWIEAGDGVRHAVVTAAERGVLLRFEGPLGLAGHAVHMVHTYELERVAESSTRIKVSVHAAGEVHDGWADTVQGVWDHFINEQFVPYVEAGRHLQEEG